MELLKRGHGGDRSSSSGKSGGRGRRRSGDDVVELRRGHDARGGARGVCRRAGGSRLGADLDVAEEGTMPRRIRKTKNNAIGRSSYLGSDNHNNNNNREPLPLGSGYGGGSARQNSGARGLFAGMSQRLRNTGFFASGFFPTAGINRTTTATDNNTTMLGLRTKSIDEFCKDSPVLMAFLDDPLLLPKRIAYDEITFLRSLSKGAYGEVWLGQLETSHVAIKCLLPEKRMFKSNIEQFAAEIQLMSTLHHPNIVSFVGVSWRRMEDLCAVVEYMESGDLDVVLKKKKDKLSWNKEKISIAMDVAEGLVYLHCMRPIVVHRDLKSKNVLLNRQMHAKLSDFGVSRKTTINETMTSGVGTLLWTAPEIIEGKKYSEQADIYSLGVVLSEIDTCEAPFAHVKNEAGEKLPPMQIAQNVRLGKVRVQLRDDCPLKMRELILSCTQLDPDARPTSMQVAFTLKSIIAPGLQRAVSIEL
ncbi:Tkl protein kinase, partial [Globisporangium splendens]